MFSLVNIFSDFYRKQGFELISPVPLNHESFPTTFVPSGGEPHLFEILKSKKEYSKTEFIVVQPCIRAVDIGKVGNDTHSSFFEMMVVFSFLPPKTLNRKTSVESYFREQRQRYFEILVNFLLKELKISKDKLWVTYFKGDVLPVVSKKVEPDDFAYEFCKKVGIREQNIVGIGYPENYLFRIPKEFSGHSLSIPAGDDHEPVSHPDINFYAGRRIEIFFDRGIEFGCGKESCKPTLCDCQRFVEVATSGYLDKYISVEEGHLSLTASENRIIYIGYGFERLSQVTQGSPSVYDIKEFSPIMEYIRSETGSSPFKKETLIRKIYDFARSSIFAASTETLPSKKGRGLILRELIKKFALYSWILNVHNKSFMTELIQHIISIYGPRYPHLTTTSQQVIDVILKESEDYTLKLEKGLQKLIEVGSSSGLPKEVLDIYLSRNVATDNKRPNY